MKKKVHLIKVRLILTSLLHCQKKMYKCLRRERAYILIVLLLLVVFLFLSQLIVNLQILDVELRMESSNLHLAQVEALAKIFGSSLFRHLLEVI